jgi:hypothetical protein
VLRRLGIKKPTKNEEILVIAYAHYEAGFTAVVDTVGMEYAFHRLADALTANHGHFPASYWTGQGANRIPTNGPDSHQNDINQNAKGPADWASIWGNKASGVQASISTLYPNLKDPHKLKGVLRQTYIKLEDRLAWNVFQKTKSEINATPGLSTAQRKALIGAAHGRYEYALHHPLATTATGARYNGTAGHVRQLYQTGRCKAEEKANVHRKAIEGAGKTTAHHAAVHTNQNATMIFLLQQIAKNTGGNAATKPGPAQGLSRRVPSRSGR